jgi:hypothetical protein
VRSPPKKLQGRGFMGNAEVAAEERLGKIKFGLITSFEAKHGHTKCTASMQSVWLFARQVACRFVSFARWYSIENYLKIRDF